MKHRRPASAVYALLGAAIASLSCARPWEPEPLVAPLRLEATAEEIASDLEAYLPAALRRAGVPGLAVAVVRDGELILERGYGVRNAWTREPVTPETLFEVASNSKMVTAHSALRLVETGLLELEGSLASYVGEPFLPPSLQERGSEITLRQVLTHRSGLKNEPSGELVMLFEPGERFSYSGQGFEYAAAAIEGVTGRPFVEHVEATALGPLGMRSSGYGAEPRLVEAMASPHVDIGKPWVVSGVIALVVLVLLSGVRWAWRRLRRGSGRSSGCRWLFVVSALAGILVFFVPFGFGNAVRLGFASTVLFGALAVAVFLWGSTTERRKLVRRVAAIAVLSVVVWALLSHLPVPLELRAPGAPAASGLRSTAGDLALFLDELMHPTLLGSALASEMMTPQVRIDERASWGLGVGIQTGDRGNAVWHWGVNYPNYQSLAVGFPEERIGVVVLTNGGPMALSGGSTRMAGLELAREVAYRAIGGEHYRYWADVP